MLNTGLSADHNRGRPLYTLQNTGTGETQQTTDPGLAMITGKWDDVGKFKVPVLRGLAARAPYFHNGDAVSLTSVVVFYNDRFHIGLSSADIFDLTNFLASL
jgi:cytochrome c peroxidase